MSASWKRGRNGIINSLTSTTIGAASKPPDKCYLPTPLRGKPGRLGTIPFFSFSFSFLAATDIFCCHRRPTVKRGRYVSSGGQKQFPSCRHNLEYSGVLWDSRHKTNTCQIKLTKPKNIKLNYGTKEQKRNSHFVMLFVSGNLKLLQNAERTCQ